MKEAFFATDFCKSAAVLLPVILPVILPITLPPSLRSESGQPESGPAVSPGHCSSAGGTASVPAAPSPPGRRDSIIKNKKKDKLNTTPHEELLKELEYLRAENAYLKKLQALVEERIVRESGKEPKPSKD